MSKDYDMSEECTTESGRHVPDWQTVVVDFDGDTSYLDITCSVCGLSGCIGKADEIEKNIDW